MRNLCGLVITKEEACFVSQDVPIYLVSPQLFVTKEHIISARASSSLSFASVGWSWGLGEAVPLVGLGRAVFAGASPAVDGADWGTVEGLRS